MTFKSLFQEGEYQLFMSIIFLVIIFFGTISNTFVMNENDCKMPINKVYAYGDESYVNFEDFSEFRKRKCSWIFNR